MRIAEGALGREKLEEAKLLEGGADAKAMPVGESGQFCCSEGEGGGGGWKNAVLVARGEAGRDTSEATRLMLGFGGACSSTKAGESSSDALEASDWARVARSESRRDEPVCVLSAKVCCGGR